LKKKKKNPLEKKQRETSKKKGGTPKGGETDKTSCEVRQIEKVPVGILSPGTKKGGGTNEKRKEKGDKKNFRRGETCQTNNTIVKGKNETRKGDRKVKVEKKKISKRGLQGLRAKRREGENKEESNKGSRLSTEKA